jgi:hypothetical protein
MGKSLIEWVSRKGAKESYSDFYASILRRNGSLRDNTRLRGQRRKKRIQSKVKVKSKKSKWVPFNLGVANFDF